MQIYIQERAKQISKYIIKSGCTTRQAAKKFGVSRATAHLDITERISQINPYLATNVRKVLENNKAVRHVRGGQATKKLWEEIRQKNAV